MKGCLTQEELFDKLTKEAGDGKKNCELLVVCEKKAYAILYQSKLSPVKNAFIIVIREEEVAEWFVEDWHVKCCPLNIAICIKSLKILSMCVQNSDEKEEYFSIDNKHLEKSQKIVVYGAVEIEKKSTIFYYDGETHKSNYLHEISYLDGEMDSYCLIRTLRDLMLEICNIRKGDEIDENRTDREKYETFISSQEQE